MAWWEALVLGLVQGLTEFIPVSSSGHLVLGRYILGMEFDPSVTFEVFVHFGTVLSIITVYRSRLAAMVVEGAYSSVQPRSWAGRYREHQEFRTIVYLLITLVPTGIVYVLFKDFFEGAFADPRFAAGMLYVTALLLLLTLLRRKPSGELTPLKVFVMGVAQSAAMIPGISRSGSTICAGLYQNVSPEEAANFSFLMLLPVVLGATLIESIGMFNEGATFQWNALIIGTIVAYLSGILAIKLVIGFVKRGNLFYFAFYLIVIATLGMIFIPANPA